MRCAAPARVVGSRYGHQGGAGAPHQLHLRPAGRVYPHVVRLRPAPHSRTPIEAYSLRVEPADHFINWQQDAFGNFLARLVFPNRCGQLTITVGLIADLKVINPFDFFIEDWAETLSAVRPTPRRWPTTSSPTCGRSTKPATARARVNWCGRGCATSRVPRRHPHHRLPGRAQPRGQRRRRATACGWSPACRHRIVTLRTGIGSCRDSAWLLVSILRQLGLAARFVSGYLVQLASDVEALDGPSGPAADFTDLHAWAEVYIPGAGWIGLDPTSGLFAGEGHIPLAATPHPASAAPITGATEPCEVDAGVRQHRHPRPRGPARHAALHRRGVASDLRARPAGRRAAGRGDVRLTIGGEPTFVSIDNQVDAEWTTAADGPHKRQRASDLAARLKPVWAPAGAGPARPGQVVSRRAVAALADRAALAHRRAAAVDRRRRCWPTRGRPSRERTPSTTRPPTGCSPGSPTAWDCRPPGAAGLRGPAAPAGRQGPPARRDPVDAERRPRGPTSAAGRAALLARLDESTTAPAGVRAAAAPPRR